MDKVVRSYKLGPSGGNGGREFADTPIPLTSRITQVQVWSSESINAVQVLHESRDGTSRSLELHGAAGGQLQTFTLGRGEYISGIRGGAGDFVETLQFQTNKQRQPLFGRGLKASDYRLCVVQGFFFSLVSPKVER